MKAVFISSTGKDLAEYRKAAIEICNYVKLLPLPMEFFEAMGVGATEGSKLHLTQADLYVGIVAFRFGYIEEGYQKSVTEIEFDYAHARGLERLCFVADSTFPWPPDVVDDDRRRINDFRHRIRDSVICRQFTTVDDFKLHLLNALVEWKARHDAETGCRDTTPAHTPVARVPPQPTLLMGRGAEVELIKERIGIAPAIREKRFVVLRGWPGVGKTSLMKALAYDADVEAALPDGVLWASLGRDGDSLANLRLWAPDLGFPVLSQGLPETIGAVRGALQTRRALLLLDDALELGERIDGGAAEADSLNSLGNALSSACDFDRAEACHETARAMSARTGNRVAERDAVSGLAAIHSERGEAERAIQFLEQARELSLQIGDKRGESSACGRLGDAYVALGSFDIAIQQYSNALTMAGSTGDLSVEGAALNNLGRAYLLMEPYPEAIESYQRSLMVASSIGEPSVIELALNSLGTAYAANGELELSLECYSNALDLSRAQGDKSAGE